MALLKPGDRVDLTIEKPVPGGRMLARHEGQIVFVAGSIPGERVSAVVERVDKRFAFASATEILEPSPDRRAGAQDPLCGGSAYAHVEPVRQRLLKGEVIADAFARVGRHPLPAPPAVAASPEQGYRLRARLHVRSGQAGFYREGTHDLCDPAATGQLHPVTLPAVAGVLEMLRKADVAVSSVDVSENLPADQRAIHVDTLSVGAVAVSLLESALGEDVSSISATSRDGVRTAAGRERIADALATLTQGRAPGELQRSVASFFQANRYLLPELVVAVMGAVLPDGDILDLYSGVGLFAAALAASGRSGVTAVEGNPASGADLRVNAAAWPSRLTVVVTAVEGHLASLRGLPPTVIVDPPRTGLSKETAEGLAKAEGVRRLVYVSCDPPTMARDARIILDGGFTLTSLQAFDLFPNTPHVEALAIFDRPVRS